MQEKSSGTPWNDALWMAERAIVLQILRSDKEARWTLAELQVQIDDLNPHALNHGLDRLLEEGIVVTCGAMFVLASRCAWHLDMLGMVSI